MDNASKALIMAGTILIAVAFVGVGVYLYLSLEDPADDVSNQMYATKVQLKNAEFEMFEGNKVKAHEVKILIRKVEAFNKENVFPRPIEISGDILTTEQVVDTDSYKVQMYYDDTNEMYLDYIMITNL